MPAPLATRFASFTQELTQKPPKSVFCLPCTLTRDKFVCVAEFEDRPPLWFIASCLEALLDHGDGQVDVDECLRKFTQGFDSLYSRFNAINADSVDGAIVFEASLAKSNNDTATSDVYGLPSGHILCFGEVKLCLSGVDLVLLQRINLPHASTFDAVLFRRAASRDRAVELRLVQKLRQESLVGWCNACGVSLACSPSEPIKPSWILDSFDDGVSTGQIVSWISGGDETSEDDDSEWCESESDGGFVCDEEDEDEDWDPADARAELLDLEE